MNNPSLIKLKWDIRGWTFTTMHSPTLLFLYWSRVFQFEMTESQFKLPGHAVLLHNVLEKYAPINKISHSMDWMTVSWRPRANGSAPWWCYWEWQNLREWGAQGRSLGHWGVYLKGMWNASPFRSCFLHPGSWGAWLTPPETQQPKQTVLQIG